ncbi:transposase [Streptomyces sp. NPDC048419]|uniref:transposase n=1 Tax=Streptomyces sp. NPDC048419 TaxID=3365547 RepID=UPI00371247B4
MHRDPARAVVAGREEVGEAAYLARRRLIEGIWWRTRAGAPWWDVPERYGLWDRVYDLFPQISVQLGCATVRR